MYVVEAESSDKKEARSRKTVVDATARLPTRQDASTTSNMALLKVHSIINTANPVLLQEAFGLMAIKANVLAYSTVFHTAGIFMAFGGIAALFVRETKREYAPGEKPKHEHVMVEM